MGQNCHFKQKYPVNETKYSQSSMFFYLPVLKRNSASKASNKLFSNFCIVKDEVNQIGYQNSVNFSYKKKKQLTNTTATALNNALF